MLHETELLSREEIKKMQEKKLAKLLLYLEKNSKYYSRLFKNHNIDISEIKTLEDLQKIPVTTKTELQKCNDDFICIPKRNIIDYITTSGTLGDPVTFAMSDKDLDRLAYNESRSFEIADGNRDDIYLQMVTIDKRFMAGLAYYLGARKLGAGIIRVGGGMPELQWDTIKRIKPTAVITVPSFMLKLIEYAEKNGIDYNNTSIKKAVCIGEPIRNDDFTLNTLGQKIKEKWSGIKLYSTYASTEMATAFTECSAGKGGHHQPDLIICEFLDENNKPVNENEAGELTITTLDTESMPLLRFKTGDVMRHYIEKCKCGRNTMRVGPVLGRKKQMIKFKGTTLYPPALYDVIEDINEIENYIIQVSTNKLGTDDVTVLAGVKNIPDKFEKIIKDKFRAKLRVAPRVIFSSPKEIQQIQFPEGSRKPIKFIDKRDHKI